MFIYEKPTVSVIVPVYNTEKYLVRAIESILGQTYTNIEIILVNDGSTDHSGEICEEYAIRDSRVKVFHQKNSGVSATRNFGLKVAQGDYIQFVDSDDEIISYMIETLIEEVITQKCDVVICGYSVIGREKKVSSKASLYKRDEFLFLGYIDQNISQLILSSCNMLFKSSLINCNKLKFNSSYIMGEDGLFTLEYLLKCRNIYVINETLYNYYIYDSTERISAVSYFTPDVYELKMEYFKKLYHGIKDNINSKEKIILMQRFYDQLIAGLVRLGAYYQHFSYKEILSRLSNVINDSLVLEAGKVYKRKRNKGSILIPLFIRLKCKKLLFFAIKKKGKNFISKYGKRDYVRLSKKI